MRIAVIGLGIIGSRLAANWIKAGHDVIGWNRTKANVCNAGIRLASSPAEAACLSEVIVVVVADPAAANTVIGGSSGVASVALEGKLVIHSSTVDPECNIKLESLVNNAGGLFLEAPFTGSKDGAEKGKLIYFTAGDKPAYEKAMPFLLQTGTKVLYFGKTGAASDVKLALNVMLANTMQSISEGLRYIEQAGIERDAFVEAFKLNAGWCPLAEMKMPNILANEYPTHFSLKHMYKDVGLAVKRARELKAKMTLARLTESLYAEAMGQGWGEQDFSVVSKNA